MFQGKVIPVASVGALVLVAFLAPPVAGQLNMSSLNLSGRSVGGGVQGSAAAQRSRQTGTTGAFTGTGMSGQGLATTGISTNVGFVGASSQSMVNLSALRGSTTNQTFGTGSPFGSGTLGGVGGFANPLALGRSGLGGLGFTQLGRGGLGGLGQPGQLGQFNQLGGQGNLGRTQQQMPIPVRLGFPAVHSRPNDAAVRFQTRLTRIPSLAHLTGVQAVVEGSTVVLRGTVPTEHDREVLERVALLEPGIAAVRNELVVETQQ